MTKEMLIKKLKMALDNIGDEEVLNQLNTIKNIIYKDNTTQNWDTINTILDMTGVFLCFNFTEIGNTGIAYRLNFNTDKYEIMFIDTGNILEYDKDQAQEFVNDVEKNANMSIDYLKMERMLKLGHLCSGFPTMNGRYKGDITNIVIRQRISGNRKNYKELIVDDKLCIVCFRTTNSVDDIKKCILDYEDSSRRVMQYMKMWCKNLLFADSFKAMVNILERQRKTITAATD